MGLSSWLLNNHFGPCIKEGVSVQHIRHHDTRNVFEVVTSIGTYTADQVVVATGGGLSGASKWQQMPEDLKDASDDAN